ncbi:hypothetical protein OS493_036977, partial [Desmophyllum pertusum]
NGLRGFSPLVNHKSTAWDGSNSVTGGPSEDIRIRASVVSVSRQERFALLMRFWWKTHARTVNWR